MVNPRLACAPRAARRQRAAAEAVAAHPIHAEVVVLAPTLEAGSRVLRMAVQARPAAFGWQRTTLSGLAARLAAAGLAAQGLAQAGAVVLEAICARTVHRLRADGALGRYAPIGDRPGLPRALSRTFLELGLAGVGPSHPGLEPDLARLYAEYRTELRDAGLADRADVLAAATARAEDPAPHPLLDRPLVLLDPALGHAKEHALVAALARRASVEAFAPTGDARAIAALEAALGVTAEDLDDAPPSNALGRLQARLFAGDVEGGGPLDESVELLSAPGESRECVEIARRVIACARDGVPFDRMAVLAHGPERYRASLVEAFRRAEIPAWFSRGTVRPDPTGRALLALLACRERHLSARAFAEYLSLGVVPDPEDADRAVEWLDEDEAAVAPVEDDGPIDDERAVVRGTLRAPWRWERLLVEAAVIDADRWRRRLEGLAASDETKLAALEPDDPMRQRYARRRADLEHLMAFALPLMDELAALPSSATWGEWAAHLDALARRAIRRPERVLAVLRELAPMAPIGPVGLAEVQLVLGPRLTEMRSAPSSAPAGKLFVGTTAEARGLSFDVVFVPGLVERGFPRRVPEDPICLDARRAVISPELATAASRVEAERLALRLCAGAAERRIVLSYPRLDTDRGRARVPSFYALEVIRAVEGRLPSISELGRRAEAAGGARMSWPAPRVPEDAIDGAEYDLAVLDGLLHAEVPPDGAARYLLEANPHLARALRARYARWQSAKWTSQDGLVNPAEPARAALARFAPGARPYSATALEQLAACPYRFYLRSVLGLAPHEMPEALEALDPLTRGSLMHEAQFGVLRALRERGLLPLDGAALEEARAILDAVVAAVADRFREEHAPAIERVFADAVADCRADLAEWLARMADAPGWVPFAFELAFGLRDQDPARVDPSSQPEPVTLEEGLILRGAIDLVEQREGVLRATDHKTGGVPERDGPITDGGRSLQPVLYARALEVLRPDRTVSGGRLYYCTARGRFTEHAVPLGRTARDAVRTLAETLSESMEHGFLPALPSRDACDRCDYRRVCGPAEPRRTAQKEPRGTAAINRLRKLP